MSCHRGEDLCEEKFARFKCKKCLTVSHKKKFLCKPKKV